jgi:hypothetical protein
MKEGLKAVPLFIGAMFGFLVGFLLEWLAYNLVYNVAESFYLVLMFYIIMAFAFIVIGLYLLYKRSAIAGMLMLVAGIKLLNWVVFWFMPIYSGEGWFTLQWYFMFWV